MFATVRRQLRDELARKRVRFRPARDVRRGDREGQRAGEGDRASRRRPFERTAFAGTAFAGARPGEDWRRHDAEQRKRRTRHQNRND